METMLVNGLTLFFDADEREAAELVRHACEKTVRLVHECWGLGTPEDCRVYVMTSWLHFTFHSAPWPWRILLAVSLPLWYSRAKRTWQVAGGLAQAWGKRRAVGVKPPRLIQLGDRSIGDRVFVRKDDMSAMVQQNTCHELVHAFTAHLKSPVWLHEGLAMITVDKFSGKTTVKHETIETLDRSSGQASPGRYQEFSLKDQDAVVYHVVRGYWMTRYIQETQPELLKSLLSQRHSHPELENKIAAALGMSRDEFWRGIDGILVSHFKSR